MSTTVIGSLLIAILSGLLAGAYVCVWGYGFWFGLMAYTVIGAVALVCGSLVYVWLEPEQD